MTTIQSSRRPRSGEQGPLHAPRRCIDLRPRRLRACIRLATSRRIRRREISRHRRSISVPLARACRRQPPSHRNANPVPLPSRASRTSDSRARNPQAPLAFALERERVTEPASGACSASSTRPSSAPSPVRSSTTARALNAFARELLDRLAPRDRLRQYGLVVQGSPNRLRSGWNAVVALEFME